MKKILLTGASGVVGGALLAELLRDPDLCVWALIRPRQEQSAPERLARVLDRQDVAQADRARVQAVAGDLDLPELLHDPADRRGLQRRITHVIHSAADLSLDRPVPEARRRTVQGSERVVDFARACPRLRRLVLVSSAGVAGADLAELPESFITAPRRFRNSYELAKAEVEDRVAALSDAGLPVSVYRPSMVVGDSRDGRIARFQIFYALCELLAGRSTLGLLPPLRDAALDTVPIDYLVGAIARSYDDPAAVGRVFNCCSGPGRSLPLSELAQRARSAFGAAGLRLAPQRTVPAWLLGLLLPALRICAPRRLRKGLGVLPMALRYLESMQPFTSRESRAFFRRRGLRMPDPRCYVTALLDHYLTRRYGVGEENDASTRCHAAGTAPLRALS